MAKVSRLSKCRMCGNEHLVEVVDLGYQYMTGVFPKDKASRGLTQGPLRLVKCHGADACGLLQLDHSYDLGEMYGDNYGYRSGLNRQMVSHLHAKIARIQAMTNLVAGDLVIDIGANDGTSLGAYREDLLLVGVDPTGAKFRQYYKKHVQLIPNFFSAKLVSDAFPGRKAKVITSFSMLYDLEQPLAFARDIAQILDPTDGIWVFEQSYMPLMLDRLALDTICHEHLEYYGLKQIMWMLDRVGLQVVDVELNDVNGGSFSVVAASRESNRTVETDKIAALLKDEQTRGLDELHPYEHFDQQIKNICGELIQLVRTAKAEGRKVAALGASTKGNVLLQYCAFTDQDIEVVGEVNPDKFGAYTPGTGIPIEDERVVLARHYDYLIVLPWHFREFFLQNKVFTGQHLLFPLPRIEVITP
jgi:NDP-4-keto-2,6-dideoxyhexose 3-C-methyltransferase